MKKLEIIARVINGTELLKSGYATRYAEQFGYEHLLDKEIKRWDKYNATYYVVKSDASINYGLDFTIYVCYTADGINFMKEFSVGSSSISNSALRRVLISDKTISFSLSGYSKDKTNRKALRHYSECGWVFI